MNRLTMAACLLAALSTGCATRGAVRQVAEDLVAVRAEVALLRRAQDDLARQLDRVAASTGATLAKHEKLQATVNATTVEVERLATRLEATDEALKQMKEAVAVNAAATSPAPPASVPDRPRENRAGSAETTYASGLANFRHREYGQAVLDFLDVVTKHPAHALAPIAQYWIGEAYYQQHDYRQAVVEFQRVVDWGAANSRASDAMVKVGLCYHNLREATRARQAWRRVLREFPDSPAADQARTLLAQRGTAPTSRRP